MRIGIMLRAYEEKGGVGVYTRNITRQLLNRGRQHEYFLYFANDRHLSNFADEDNVTARAVKSVSKAVWDQVYMPYWFRRDRLDVIFHPKFTVPLLCRGRGVMVLHGAGWFIPETKHFWSISTRTYARMMMPVYCRAAGAVVSVSNITRNVFIERLGISPAKIKTVYFAPGVHFNSPCEQACIASIRDKYQLPGDFILSLSGIDRDDRKNFGIILEAFRIVHAQRPCKLVVAGRDCEKFRDRYAIPDAGYGKDIIFTGWIDQKDLPAFYRMATLFLYPSNMEAFPIPITEALTCGVPIITSNVFGLQELAGDAAVLVDPSRADEIAEAVLSLLDDGAGQERLSARALERARLFDWERGKRETLEILEQIGTS